MLWIRATAAKSSKRTISRYTGRFGIPNSRIVAGESASSDRTYSARQMYGVELSVTCAPVVTEGRQSSIPIKPSDSLPVLQLTRVVAIAINNSVNIDCVGICQRYISGQINSEWLQRSSPEQVRISAKNIQSS